MSTTIKETVTVGRDGLIKLHACGFKCNSKLSVVAVIEKEKSNEKKRNRKDTQRNLDTFFELAGQIDIDIDAISSLRENSLI